MNTKLIQYFEDLADTVVLNVILNGQTTISREYIIQTLLETYDIGLQVGTKAVTPESVLPVAPSEDAPMLSLDGGFIS